MGGDSSVLYLPIGEHFSARRPDPLQETPGSLVSSRQRMPFLGDDDDGSSPKMIFFGDLFGRSKWHNGAVVFFGHRVHIKVSRVQTHPSQGFSSLDLGGGGAGCVAQGLFLRQFFFRYFKAF